ncbi:ABC transporter ATP-binding protein [Variovorax sp. YR266]|uniref:ABC transporter ATP-binding protein n=1 Tax=Variovorax sp. YR266 TaxID=1884386 RepID=UPI000B8A55A3|nr:ABC transporter ATP-binding protein [Variovorax sp. YR266]
MTGDVVLSAHGLSKSFRGFVAVNDVSIQVRKRTIHALIGPNGAGKTTTFNLLTKFIQPTSGKIQFMGQDVTGLEPADIARRGLVRSFQISAVFPHMTALENVRVAVQKRRGDWFNFLYSKRRNSQYDEEALGILASVGLECYGGHLAADLSYGRKRTLELATTLALEPQVLLLDEPMAGMAHEDIDRVAAIIREIGRTRTILMVEHNLSVVSSLCTTITVLARGSVLAEGDYKTVAADERVIEAYIGTSPANV